MPANLTPEYHNAEARLRAAKTDDEKLLALQEMLSKLPKHKGTDKLQADIKRRIAKLREEIGTPEEKATVAIIEAEEMSGTFDRVANTYETTHLAHGMRKSALVGMDKADIVEIPFESACKADSEVVQLLRSASVIIIVSSASDYELIDKIERVRDALAEAHIVLADRKEEADIAWFILAYDTESQCSEDNISALKDYFGGEVEIVFRDEIAGAVEKYTRESTR